MAKIGIGCPTHNMDGKFDGVYMNHLTKIHDEQDEEKNINREA